MAAKAGRRAKPRKIRLRGCVTYRGHKLKDRFSTMKEADDFLKKTNQVGIKEAYPCSICGSIHIGRVLSGK